MAWEYYEQHVEQARPLNVVELTNNTIDICGFTKNTYPNSVGWCVAAFAVGLVIALVVAFGYRFSLLFDQISGRGNDVSDQSASFRTE